MYKKCLLILFVCLCVCSFSSCGLTLFCIWCFFFACICEHRFIIILSYRLKSIDNDRTYWPQTGHKISISMLNMVIFAVVFWQHRLYYRIFCCNKDAELMEFNSSSVCNCLLSLSSLSLSLSLLCALFHSAHSFNCSIRGLSFSLIIAE